MQIFPRVQPYILRIVFIWYPLYKYKLNNQKDFLFINYAKARIIQHAISNQNKRRSYDKKKLLQKINIFFQNPKFSYFI